jgi:hypothetical protein
MALGVGATKSAMSSAGGMRPVTTSLAAVGRATFSVSLVSAGYAPRARTITAENMTGNPRLNRR